MIRFSGIDLCLNGKTIFKDFSFCIQKGEKVLLSSPSGTGKTCFFNIIMGYIRPEAGSVTVDGKTLTKDTVTAIRSRICYLGQESLVPAGNVGDVLHEIGDYRVNRCLDFSMERITGLLEEFSLSEDTLRKHTDELSGGERKRLAYVICKLLDRDIWLLDEITAGLDEERKKLIISDIASSGKTVIAASHDPDWKAYGFRELVW